METVRTTPRSDQRPDVPGPGWLDDLQAALTGLVHHRRIETLLDRIEESR